MDFAESLTSRPWEELNLNDPEEIAQATLIERNASLLERSLARALAFSSVEEESAAAALAPAVREQLFNYVRSIASLYHDVHFHSFEHASHVTMNTAKLIEFMRSETPNSITDPWLHFFVIFAALVHDVDHRGVTNKQLLEEEGELSKKYAEDGSIAERNSIDVALNLLFQQEFEDFRSCILCDAREERFEILVHAVILCTDIASPERRQMGKEKWNAAFASDSETTLRQDAIMEQVLQMTDVGHCTQAWSTFCKWNRRLYDELREAHLQGRGPDPQIDWYEGQIGFFDYYIIPLAERVGTSGTFSVEDGQALIEGAKKNRDRWIEEGRHVTEAIIGGSDERRGRVQPSQSPPLFDVADAPQKATGAARRGSIQSVATDFTWTTTGSNSENSSSKGDAMRRRNIWSRMMNKNDKWDEDDEDASKDSLFVFGKKRSSSTFRFFKNLLKHPHVLILSLLTFAVLTTGGLLVVQKMAESYESEMLLRARSIAQEMGGWFSDEFDRLLVPMFTISNMVKNMDVFHDLPDKIKAAPPLAGKETTHRDVAGICDDPIYMEPFMNIVDTIKKDSSLQGLLVNARVAPYATECLIHPMNNTQDFPDGIFFESTNSFGHDWLNDPHPLRSKILRKTVLDDVVTIAGPLTVDTHGMRTNDPNSAVMEEMYCAHLSINMPGFELPIDDEVRSTYGFVRIMINWAEVKARSDIYDRFSEHNMIFKLVRFEDMYDEEKDVYYQKETIIAKSEDADRLEEDSCVMVPLKTSNGEWNMIAGYPAEDLSPSWEKWLSATVVIAAFVISTMLSVVLIEKRLNQKLLYKMMPTSAVKRLQRGETVVERFSNVTIFFSDIVGFTSMSGEMTPIEVMRMLNDLYGEFDKLVDKHNLYKVETVGDAYMVLGGAPGKISSTEGAEKVALFALDAIECVKTFRTAQGEQIFIRAGLASGPVVAGVVGTNMPRYCLFGDTVNFASRMESTSQKMRIQCSDKTYHLLRNAPNYHFTCEERREGDRVGVNVKGKGQTHTWWIRKAVNCVSQPLTEHDSESFADEDIETGVPAQFESDPPPKRFDALDDGRQKKRKSLLKRLRPRVFRKERGRGAPKEDLANTTFDQMHEYDA